MSCSGYKYSQDEKINWMRNESEEIFYFLHLMSLQLNNTIKLLIVLHNKWDATLEKLKDYCGLLF